ncbi:MAG: hypothetical protein M9897_00095 [Brumimicrobium sp.]|nr:hypothetical protein [Brumimicrobium sp.]
MKQYIYLFILLFIASSFVGCKKDTAKPKEDGTLKIHGTWKIESMNFLDNVIIWNDNVEYNVANYFGYAPAMFEQMWGMEFRKEKIASGEGYKLIYFNEGEYNQNSEIDRWYWNFKEDKQSFEMQQINLSMPPYNFTMRNIHNLKVSDDNKKIVYKAVVDTRRSGKPSTDIVDVEVEVTLIKGTPNRGANILLFGQPYSAGEL